MSNALPSGGQLIARLKELAGKAGHNIYERLKTVDVLFKNQLYVNAGYGDDECAALDKLEEEYFGDLCGARSLGTLLTLYRAYPDTQIWEDHKWNLQRLLAKWQLDRKPANSSGTTRQTVKLADHEKLVDELAGVNFRFKQEREEKLDLRKENAALRQRIADLERENLQLNAKVVELEKLLDKHFVQT